MWFDNSSLSVFVISFTFDLSELETVRSVGTELVSELPLLAGVGGKDILLSEEDILSWLAGVRLGWGEGVMRPLTMFGEVKHRATNTNLKSEKNAVELKLL